MELTELEKGMKVIHTMTGEILTFESVHAFHAYCLDFDGQGVFIEPHKLERADTYVKQK